jgi:hypothetical protein
VVSDRVAKDTLTLTLLTDTLVVTREESGSRRMLMYPPTPLSQVKVLEHVDDGAYSDQFDAPQPIVVVVSCVDIVLNNSQIDQYV